LIRTPSAFCIDQIVPGFVVYHLNSRLKPGASGYVSDVVAWLLEILIGQKASNSPIKIL
jgi:hypothetical protein